MENTLLNLIPAAYLPEIHLSQYDIGRTLTFTLKDGASDYSVPSGASVKVKATKPSGFGFEVACTFNGGTVTLVTTETMTLENGRFPAELSIVSGNTTIGTSNFIFNIERSPHPEGTTDGDAETIIPELTLLVERIEAAAEDVDEKSELFLNLSAEAETLPAGSPATASYSNGVLTLGIPRGYDGDDTKADAIVKSASGEVASFTDGGNGLLVKSLIANITPKQSGSGDPSPSNVRPISGWDSVDVEVAGKNVLKATMDNTGVSGGLTWTVKGTSVKINGTSASAYPGYTIGEYILPKGTYTISKTTIGTVPSGGYFYIILERPGSSALATTRNTNSVTFTTTEDYNIRLRIVAEGNNLTWNNTEIDVQLEIGNTATSYEPYQAESYTTSLGQTVYGGTLDVVSGVLTLTKGFVDLGSLNWTLRTQWTPGNRFLSNEISNKKAGSYNILCSQYKPMQERVSITDTGQIAPANNTNSKDMVVRDDRYSDATAFKNAVSGVQLVYELATPTEIQLTPTQVTTLLGNNNIWADSGSVEVEYRADTTLAYNELLSLIASLS